MFLVAMLVSLLGLANDQIEIRISQVSFNQSSTANITAGSSTVSSAVTYNPSTIPDEADIYVEQINESLMNKYDDQLLVGSISYGAIEFVIAANTSTASRTFIVSGNSSTTLTIVQAGVTSGGGGSSSEDTSTDTKLDIQGNWILQRTYTTADSSAWYDDITFYNGLGYPDQIINVGASSTGTNMVTPVVYDSHMRDDSTVFMPYPAAGSQLAREASPISAQCTYYSSKYSSADGTRAYSQTLYEASSLGRTTGERKSGSTYASRSITRSYGTNAANEVLCLSVAYGTSGSVSSATLSTSYYPAASLYKATVTDEDGGQKIEYRDKNGNIVLEKALISGTTYADTYYSYDNTGRLLWVVTPQGSSSLTGGASYSASNTMATLYSYIYAYDGYGNLTEKRQPGREAEYYVYDKGKRCVMYQDGNIRTANQWIYTTYDNLNRVVEKTLVSTTLSRTSLQGLYHASSFQNSYENLSNPNIPANSTSVTAVKVLYSARHYGYACSSSNDIPADLKYAATSIVSALDNAIFNHGQLKYEKHLLLTTGTALQYRQTAYYYNSKGELLQTVTKYPNGSILRTSYKYDFIGNVTKKEEICGTATKLTTYTYNTRGKLLTESTALNGGTAATVTYAYDDLDRVKGRTYGNGTSETLSYNIQGWMTDISAKKGSTSIYSQTLRYYNPAKGTSALYSGNISEWAVQLAANAQNTYGLSYDMQGRLTGSTRYNGTATAGESAYTERGITYDRNGNILTLQRYAAALQDNYTYTYNGNRIASISGTNDGTAISGASYSYDNNGNATADGLKSLQITYNIVNLPQDVTQSGITKATYGWFADGTKYSVLDADGNGYYYIGSLIYSCTAGTTALESTDFGEGRITLSGTTQTIHYHHKDHLGSIRAITNGSGSTIEQNAYYPFGGRHTFGQTLAQATANRYKFNGKELQTTGSLGLLDYRARMYDTKTARWMGQDPLAEKYYPFSPYNYCVNNPAMFVDPDGKDWYSYQESFIDDEMQLNFVTKYAWTTATSQEEMNAAGIEGSYLGKAVVVFNGYLNERLGEDGKLTGKDARPANVTIYGINGADDIKSYLGLTVSSNPNKYSMIQEGDYRLFHEQMATSVYGKNSLTYRVSELDGNLRLNPEGGINKHNGKTFMEGIFLHRTNKDGTALRSSQGCLIIDGRSWDDVEKQLGKSNNIYLKLFRQ